MSERATWDGVRRLTAEEAEAVLNARAGDWQELLSVVESIVAAHPAPADHGTDRADEEGDE